jgi:hypothetical protein
MISMASDQHCEMFRFASRKTRFVSAAFGPIQGANETKGRARAEERRRAPRLEGRSRRRLLDRPSRPLRGASDEVFGMETEGAKKLRKSAANPLKSLARVNL